MKPMDKILQVVKLIDPGLVPILQYRREAVGDDPRILEFLKLLPSNAPWQDESRAYLVVARLMYTNTLMLLWDPPDKKTTQEHLDFLKKVTSKVLIEKQLKHIMRLSFDSTGIQQAVGKRLIDGSRKAWEPQAFTDPRTASPTRYCYIITALRSRMVALTPEATERYLNGSKKAFTTRSKKGGLFDTSRYLLSLPKEAPSEVISCSVISNIKSRTYMSMCFGLILDVPGRNVLRAEPKDIETSGVQSAARARHQVGLSQFQQLGAEMNFWELLGGQCKEKLPKPSEILKNTSTHGHNEILVLGKTGYGAVKVSAVFIKTCKGKIWQDFFGHEGRIASVILREVKGHIPIVAVEDVSGRASNVVFKDWLKGNNAPLGSVGSGQSCSQCRCVHGYLPSLMRRWHECSVCRAIFCWSCGWKLKRYESSSFGEILTLMKEDFYNPGVRACLYCKARTRLV